MSHPKMSRSPSVIGGNFAAAVSKLRQSNASSLSRSVSSPSNSPKKQAVVSDFIRMQHPPPTSEDLTLQSRLTDRIRKILLGKLVSNFMAAVVLFDAYCTCTDVDARAAGLDTPSWMLAMSDVCLALYTIELCLLLYVQGCKLLKDWMVLLDLVIILCGYGELLLVAFAPSDVLATFGVLRALRLARIVRLLRLLRRTRALRELQKLVTMMATCLKALAWSFIFCFVIMTIWAMLLVELVHPLILQLHNEQAMFTDCAQCLRATSSVMDANLLLFKTVIAGDSWGDIAVPVIESFPFTAIIFVGSLLTLVFGVLNLIVAVVVDTFAEVRQRDVLNLAEELEHEIESDKKLLQKIFDRIDSDGSGRVTLEELVEGARKDPQFQSRLRVMDIDEADLEQLFQMIDTNQEGSIEAAEFIAPLSRWVHESTTAPRFIKYNMLRALHMQEELVEVTNEQFDSLAWRIEQIAHALQMLSTDRKPAKPSGPPSPALQMLIEKRPFPSPSNTPTLPQEEERRYLGKEPLPADEPAVDLEVETFHPSARTEETPSHSLSDGLRREALAPAIQQAMREIEKQVLVSTEAALRQSLASMETTLQDFRSDRPDRADRADLPAVSMAKSERLDLPRPISPSRGSVRSGRSMPIRARGSLRSGSTEELSVKTMSSGRPRVTIGGFAPPSSGPPAVRIYSEKAEERVTPMFSSFCMESEGVEEGDETEEAEKKEEAELRHEPMLKRPSNDLEF